MHHGPRTVVSFGSLHSFQVWQRIHTPILPNTAFIFVPAQQEIVDADFKTSEVFGGFTDILFLKTAMLYLTNPNVLNAKVRYRGFIY
jgi:hypothetical protein